MVSNYLSIKNKDHDYLAKLKLVLWNQNQFYYHY